MMTRTQVIQAIIDRKDFQKYLEIGVQHGENFFPIRASFKIAVDPVFKFSKLGRIRWSIVNPCNARAKFYRGTSDEYFETRDDAEIDLAFIDGLHTFDQTLRDIENTLERLNANGVIVVHDCNPPDEKAAEPADHPERAETLSQSEWSGAWCGDIWKVICHLRAKRCDLQVFVLNCDYGLGIIKRGVPLRSLNLSKDAIEKMEYGDLNANRETLLDLRPESFLPEFLNSI